MPRHATTPRLPIVSVHVVHLPTRHPKTLLNHLSQVGPFLIRPCLDSPVNWVNRDSKWVNRDNQVNPEGNR